MNKVAIRTLALILSLMTLATALPMYSFAATASDPAYNDNNNTGSGKSGVHSGVAYTWTQSQSGYRFTVVDANGKPMTNTVDLIFSEPNGYVSFGYNNCDRYTNCRTQPNSSSMINSDKIATYTAITIDDLYSSDIFKGENYPLPPITISGNSATGNGEHFKQWFMSGDGEDSLSKYSTGTVSSSSGVVTRSNSKPSVKSSNSSASKYDISNRALSALLRSSEYRWSSLADAIDALTQMDMYSSTANKMKTYNNIYSDIVTMRVQKYNESSDEAKIEAFRSINKSLKNNTNAERIYIISLLIDDEYGIGGAPKKVVLMGGRTSQDSSLFEQIPLGKANGNDGYCDEFMNFIKKDGYYLFHFLDSSLRNEQSTKSVTDIINEQGFSVIVEPVFWFKPAAWSDGAPSTPTYSNYVYGTVTNIARFYASKGYPAYGAANSTGGAYGLLCGKTGYMCMEVGKDVNTGGSLTIKPYTKSSGTISLATLNSLISNNYGTAMHIYTTKGGSPTQHTFDKPNYPIEPAAAPEFDTSKVKEGEPVDYKIVKYYEEQDGTLIGDSPYIRNSNPAIIRVETEDAFTLADWFTSSTDTTDIDFVNYEDAKDKVCSSASQTGTEPKTVTMGSNDHILYLKLTRSNNVIANPLTLYQSEISKSVSTSNTSVDGWGPLSISFTCNNMNASDSHASGKDPKTGKTTYASCNAIMADSSYNIVLKNAKAIDSTLEANGAGDVFEVKIQNGSKAGTMGVSGGTATLSDVSYDTTIWRGSDVPTVASYKVASNNSIIKLLNHYGITPANTRAANGSYTKTLSVLFDTAENSDLTLSTKHSYTGGHWSTFTMWHNAINQLDGKVTVEVYRGSSGNKSTGAETDKSLINTEVAFGGAASVHASGYMIQDSKYLKFYPYVQMTYQGTDETKKTDTYVLSEQLSSLLPNDFAEAAWYNGNEDESLTMTSSQWSLHRKAISGEDGWQGKNQVLPGGAIFNLSTETSTTKVSLVTWQTIVSGAERSALASKLSDSAYTLASAQSAHSSFVNGAKQVIEGLKVVQWVNTDVKANSAWDDGVEITGKGMSLTGLGLNNKTSTDDKHILASDATGTQAKANQGDLDVISASTSTAYFKVFADTKGNIWLAVSTNGIDILNSVNGQNTKSSNSNLTVNQILDKDTSWDEVDMELTNSYAVELNNRTKLITNFVKCLERDKGNDMTASWVEDGHWYNEAWDGIIVARENTVLTVGFGKPGVRSIALDPNLCPSKSGVSSLFTKAFLSQFRVASSSDSALASGKGAHYIGTFKGKDILLKDMENMYVSKKFYIPNANVQDLG